MIFLVASLADSENIVHFFHDIHGVGAITKEILRKRTDEYVHWVEAFARGRNPSCRQQPMEFSPAEMLTKLIKSRRPTE